MAKTSFPNASNLAPKPALKKGVAENRQPRISLASEDDPSTEGYCPLCKRKNCKKHLLACFDTSGDEGEFGVGLVAGRLYYAKEITQVLELIRLAWVQSVRATGKPKAPRWIIKERALRDYFDAIGGAGGLGLVKKESDKTAADFLPAYSDFENISARDLLEELLCSCGNWITTEEDFEALMRSTTYRSLWTYKPREIAKRFRAKLRRILLEAKNEVKPTKRKAVIPGKKTKRVKPRIMVKTTGAKKSNIKHARKRRSA